LVVASGIGHKPIEQTRTGIGVIKNALK